MAHTPKAWTFQRITPEQFRKALLDLNIKVVDFAFITGSNPVTVQRWMAGTQDVPPWVPVMLALMGQEGCMPLARAVAETLVIREAGHDNAL
jgi:hypothetical protein